jgi:hypothetical protein
MNEKVDGLGRVCSQILHIISRLKLVNFETVKTLLFKKKKFKTKKF